MVIATIRNNTIYTNVIIPNCSDNHSTVTSIVNTDDRETSDIENCVKKDNKRSDDITKCPRTGTKKYSGKNFNIIFMKWFSNFERKYIIPAFRREKES